MQTMLEAFVASRKWSKFLSVLMIIMFTITILSELMGVFDACGKQAKYFKILGVTSLVLIIISLYWYSCSNLSLCMQITLDKQNV